MSPIYESCLLSMKRRHESCRGTQLTIANEEAQRDIKRSICCLQSREINPRERRPREMGAPQSTPKSFNSRLKENCKSVVYELLETCHTNVTHSHYPSFGPALRCVPPTNLEAMQVLTMILAVQENQNQNELFSDYVFRTNKHVSSVA